MECTSFDWREDNEQEHGGEERRVQDGEEKCCGSATPAATCGKKQVVGTYLGLVLQ